MSCGGRFLKWYLKAFKKGRLWRGCRSGGVPLLHACVAETGTLRAFAGLNKCFFCRATVLVVGPVMYVDDTSFDLGLEYFDFD